MKINFKSTSTVFNIMGGIFLAIAGLIALFEHIIIASLVALSGIFCLVLSLYYHLRKPKKPEIVGCLNIVELKFRKK